MLRRVVMAGAGGAAMLLATAVVGQSGEDSSVAAVPCLPNYTRHLNPNWDRLEPMSLINLNRLKGNQEDDLKRELKKYEARVRRHIFLIRHGQYNVDGETDSERVLTPLGREQANLTGERLANLGYTYNKIIYSTMERAKETSEINNNHLKGVKRTGSDLLKEGAPIRPDPQNNHWKPDVVHGPRIESAFRNYIHRADYNQKENCYEVIVCHDNVIRYIVCRKGVVLCTVPDLIQANLW